ncbi:polyphosphate polymerase domain-containing protein [Christensenellaceae bacterium OttesenSCG-928-L17]|nr:polyphosphate polymerase domain-containing protein [Christensenellaceae bacterium OttesenSCG-928-L17]
MTKSEVQYVFERFEKKYVLTASQYNRLLAALSPHMQGDCYGLHTISSIYFDTADYAVIRHSLDKPDFKQKLRLRSYGTPQSGDPVYLELKKKYNGVVFKRRIALPLREAQLYVNGGEIATGNNQIFREIDWYYHTVRPEAKVFLSYDRSAYFGKDDPELRMTFDQNIRWRDYHLDLGRGSYGQPLIGADQRLMEIKTSRALPYWLSVLLSELRIYPTSFSKYGTVYCTYLLPEKELSHVG